jgi:hypothetical protein
MAQLFGLVVVVIVVLAIIGSFVGEPNAPPERSEVRHRVQSDREYFDLGSDKGLRDPLPTPPAKPEPKPAAPAAEAAK